MRNHFGVNVLFLKISCKCVHQKQIIARKTELRDLNLLEDLKKKMFQVVFRDEMGLSLTLLVLTDWLP